MMIIMNMIMNMITVMKKMLTVLMKMVERMNQMKCSNCYGEHHLLLRRGGHCPHGTALRWLS